MPTWRQQLAAREYRQFVADEEKLERERQDKQEYAKYTAAIDEENADEPPALRITPLSFEQWRKFAPNDVADPVLRGAATTNHALIQNEMKVTKERIATAELDDSELRLLGYDLSERIYDPDLELTPGVLAQFFCRVEQEHPQFDRSHIGPIGDFLTRNRLFPGTDAIARTLHLLLAVNLIQPRQQPEPEKPNLNIAPPSPEAVREQQRRDYLTKPVVSDPRTGETLTAYHLDRISADEYKRIMAANNQFVNVPMNALYMRADQ